ncbi:MAG: hypothetical protein EA380_10775 [Phycisphaeraceae bacterium]|nr:MAG: hypothetical protein EA380_10775 [Phycisphaeraceae bacterium]
MIALANARLEARTERVDLRRRGTRRYAEVALARSAHALPDDRALLEAVYERGVPAARVAALMHQPPRLVRRRLRIVIERLMSPEAGFVLRHMREWEPQRRRIATACILQGRSMREASRHLRMSLHTVRRELDAIRALMPEEAR